MTIQCTIKRTRSAYLNIKISKANMILSYLQGPGRLFSVGDGVPWPLTRAARKATSDAIDKRVVFIATVISERKRFLTHTEYRLVCLCFGIQPTL